MQGVAAAIITSGREALSIERVLRGEEVGTIFLRQNGASPDGLA